MPMQSPKPTFRKAARKLPREIRLERPWIAASAWAADQAFQREGCPMELPTTPLRPYPRGLGGHAQRGEGAPIVNGLLGIGSQAPPYCKAQVL
jgi:hypothetical protein